MQIRVTKPFEKSYLIVSGSGAELWQKHSWQIVDTISSLSHHMTSKSEWEKCVLSQGCRQMRINSFQMYLFLPWFLSGLDLGDSTQPWLLLRQGLLHIVGQFTNAPSSYFNIPSAGITPRELAIHNSLQIFFNYDLFFVLCVNHFAYVFMSVHHVCLVSLEARRGYQIPRTGVLHGCKPPHGC